MEFFVNHTRKSVEFAGIHAHLNKFLVRLNELVATKNWELTDDVCLIGMDIDSEDTIESVRTFIFNDAYAIDDEYYEMFLRPEDLAVTSEQYERELSDDSGSGNWGVSWWPGWNGQAGDPHVTTDV